MRIISPTGTIDVPYDLVCLQMDGYGAIHCNAYGSSFRLCSYSSREKAMAVMKAIRNAYDNCYDIYQLPKDGEVKVDE